MKERDYVMASDLATLRAAKAVLQYVVPQNVSEALRVSPDQADAEFRHIMRCLDCWVARLELAVGAISEQNEPDRRVWPDRT